MQPNFTPPPHQVTLRRHKLFDDYGRILFGKALDSFKAVEDEALPIAAELLPDAAEDLRRAFIRIIGLYVADPEGLIGFMVQRYIDVLQAYAYGAERDPARAEGASDFWLFKGGNDHLNMMDHAHIPGMSAFLVLNTHQVLAARSILRLQALLMDMDKIRKIETIHQIMTKAEIDGFVEPEGFNPPDPLNFEPLAAAGSEAQGAAKPKLDA